VLSDIVESLKKECHRNGKSVTHETLGNCLKCPTEPTNGFSVPALRSFEHSALAAPIMPGIPQGLKPRGILDKIECW
jgi:hypothetical protein